LAEFTGERVVPGKVNADLWNEHRSRYLFAARLGEDRRLLDLGCGTGYGAAELAGGARCVIGLDQSMEAVSYATHHYGQPNLHFLCACATTIPLAAEVFDLVVAYELIEHVPEWRLVLPEVKRVLAPKGLFVVSTPNKLFYEETRRLSGPNPYHAHEFEFDEFRQALTDSFPFVSFFLQNHSSGIVFHPLQGDPTAEVRVDSFTANPKESNFFIAVCGLTRQAEAATFVYIPSAANVLRERSEHIRLLEDELDTKNGWLDGLRQRHEELVQSFRALEGELEERNRWADSLDRELQAARAVIDQLNNELAERGREYAALEKEKEIHTTWALETDRKLAGKIKELAQCVDLLHATEKTLEERTLWAQQLDERVQKLEALLARVEASRWHKLGRSVGLGPEVLQK
jgi:SAM-dependent methyltransferase